MDRVKRAFFARDTLVVARELLRQALAVDRQFDGADLCAPDALLFLEEDVAIPDDAVATGPRVGVRGEEVAPFPSLVNYLTRVRLRRKRGKLYFMPGNRCKPSSLTAVSKIFVR